MLLPMTFLFGKLKIFVLIFYGGLTIAGILTLGRLRLLSVL